MKGFIFGLYLRWQAFVDGVSDFFARLKAEVKNQ